MKIDLGSGVVIEFGDIPIIRVELSKPNSTPNADLLGQRKERKAVFDTTTAPFVHFLEEGEMVV